MKSPRCQRNIAQLASLTKDEEDTAMASKFVQPDEILSAIVGPEQIARNQITEKVLEYAAGNGLIDLQTKTKINADEKLRLLFDGKESISMFELNKYIMAHIS
jgi:chromatin remodeling complex protein RSC6